MAGFKAKVKITHPLLIHYLWNCTCKQVYRDAQILGQLHIPLHLCELTGDRYGFGYFIAPVDMVHYWSTGQGTRIRSPLTEGELGLSQRDCCLGLARNSPKYHTESMINLLSMYHQWESRPPQPPAKPLPATPIQSKEKNCRRGVLETNPLTNQPTCGSSRTGPALGT